MQILKINAGHFPRHVVTFKDCFPLKNVCYDCHEIKSFENRPAVDHSERCLLENFQSFCSHGNDYTRENR